MAPLLLIPLLRTLQRRFCIPHVLPNPSLPAAGGGRFSGQAQRLRLNDRIRRVVDLPPGTVRPQPPPIFGIGPDVHDDLRLGTEE